MTPEEKFNQEVWWILQEIKKEQLATPKGERVEFNIRQPDKSGIIPLVERQRKLLYKLQELGVLKVEIGDAFYTLFDEPKKYFLSICQQKFDKFYKKWGGIDENPWLSEESRITQRKKLFKGQQKQSKENTINFPTDPEVIEEYLNILNRIEKERQRTPKGEPIAFPVPKGILYAKGVPLPEQETSILRIFEQDGIIEITEKTIPIIDEFDPYENSETIRAVKIPDLDKFKNYRDKLSELKNQSGKSYKERKADAEARAKEIKKQLEEMNMNIKQEEKEIVKKEIIEETNKKLEEQRKAFEKLGKQFSSLISPDSIRAWERYKKLSQEISKQAEPMKKALEQLNAVYSGSTQNSLAPVFQRLAESIKPIGEQMKKWDEIYRDTQPHDSFLISPEIIQARQKTETILTIRSIETLLQKLLSKDKQEPTPVEIVKPKEFEIKGLEKGLETIANKMRKEDDRPKFPYKLPAGTKWENIIIKFLDDENVFISAKRKEHETNFRDMRLADSRWAVPRPNEGWIFLKVLAKYNGEITPTNPNAKDTYKKQKELLSKALQFYFNIDYDPFYPYEPYPPYKHERSYKIKIQLILQSPHRAKTSTINQKSAEDELNEEFEEFYKEQTPQVYDERGGEK